MRQHTGSQAGFNSRISYLPDVGHGVFMTMNKSPVGNIRDLISMYIYDLLLGNMSLLSLKCSNMCFY